MELISMCDYVKKIYYSEKIHDAFKLNLIDDYREFLQTPLELGMFIPCKDGQPLKEPEYWNNYIEYSGKEVEGIKPEIKEYEKAKERVVFKGFYKHHDLIYFPNQVTLETADGDFTEWQNIEWLISNSFQKLTLTPYKAKEFFPELLTPNPK